MRVPCCLAVCCAFAFVTLAAGEQPNVLFIAVDDLRPELGCYGKPVNTPNLDRFAESGIRFDRAYCQQAVCGASRLSIMGGMYPTRTGEQTFHVADWRQRQPNLVTLNQHFTANGYQTIGLGKIYHGTGGAGVDRANWSRWIDLGAPEYALPENRRLQERPRGAKPDDRDPPKGPTTELADVSDDTYADGKRAGKAVALLRQLATAQQQASAEQSKPFFLAVGLTKPHLPFAAPSKYWDLYQRDQFAMPQNRGLPPGYPRYAANLPAWEMQKYSDYEGDMPTDFSDEMNRRLLHGYAACVSYVDANIGLILDALHQHDLAKNTIVVIWGDHGWKLGDHSTWCKHTNLECDTRVPLLIRAPGGKTGVSTPRLVELIDLYPTLCQMAGIEIPPHCQGRSFARLLDDPMAGHRWAAYSSYPAGNQDSQIGHSIRFGNYRYTEWHRAADGENTGIHVLTNLQQDPGETTNVADDPQHAEALVRGRTLLAKRISQAAGDTQQPAAVEIVDDTPLQQAAGDRFRFGVGTDLGVFERPADLALVRRHFGVLTAENCMKSTVVQKREGEWDFAKADEFVERAEASGIQVVGHSLVWSRPGTTPAWFFKDGDQQVSPERLLERLRTHIHTVVGRYKGRVIAWDVVNEALADSDSEYLRDTEWCNILGEEFIVKAFQYAREADPDAMLVYNDYRCDQPAKLRKLVRLIKSVKAQGGPIDALGLQAHYEYGMIPYEGIERAMIEMRELGVKVVFSELDMDVVTRVRWYLDDGKYREEMKSFDPYPQFCPPQVLARQAEQYAKLFDVIQRHADIVERVTFWNLHDGQSWMNDWPWRRTNHPLLFDRQGKAKPAYRAVVDTLMRGPPTETVDENTDEPDPPKRDPQNH